LFWTSIPCPRKAAEIYPVLRFRLRKMVPFDVEHAGLSYQVLVENKDECKVLAAVLPGPVLAEYEAVVRAAGYEPGAVLPSGLAALEAGEAIPEHGSSADCQSEPTWR
jgi:type IV pilus assembly protein PilM